MDQLQMYNPQYNLYPEVIVFDEKNPTISSPYATMDLPFYQTRETLQDVDTYRSFIKNCEARFRASREYKAYKSYLMEYLGIDRCQEFGNISSEDATIELHHNVLGLFDIALLISGHIVNTVGYISTFDLIQYLIIEHWNNRVGVTFLSKTAHQIYTNDPNGYIPPDMTFGRWWELLSMYRYGITYEIANKVIRYIYKYQNGLPISFNLKLQEQILSFANFNEYGTPVQDCGYLPYNDEENVEIGGYLT